MATTSLLTAQQRKTCQTQSNQPDPNGPRAKALLALDKGSTQQQAADESGLSIGQVRYCLRRFRTVALELFDPGIPSASKPVSKTVTPGKADAVDSKPAKDTSKPKKDKGSKKDKGKGKALKPVKPKSEKDDKKSKKKNKKSDKKDKKASGEKGKKKNKKK